MKKRRIAAGILSLLLLLLIFGGCAGGEEETSESESSESQSSESSEPEEDPGPINPLTGETGFSEEAVGKRPFAIMVSNMKLSLPQWGVSDADIIYEACTEGGVTRLMCMFADPDSIPKTGPCRSAREYFPQFSEPFHAIYCHMGGSPTGMQTINNNGIDNINGTRYAEVVYIKDAERYATGIGQEHTYCTDAELLKIGVERQGYEIEGECPAPFKFVEDDEKASLSEEKADKVTIRYSAYNSNSVFEYDKETGKYYKSQFGEPHIDLNKTEAEGNQIAVDNVFIIYAPTSMIDSIRIRYYLEGGSGYYLSEGKVAKIQWTKGGIKDMFTFKDENGEELLVNRGKSYICMVPKSEENATVFETAE